MTRPTLLRQTRLSAPLLQSSSTGASVRQCPNQYRMASGPGGSKIEPDEILRERAFSWLDGPGKAYRKAPTNGPNYLGSSNGPRNRPFPLNPHFYSEPVLSEELRQQVYEDVAVKGESVRTVSTRYKVTMERAAAVVRLKQMETTWVKEGKPLAKPYSKAVLAMLPQTELGTQVRHESITEIPVHPYTTKQIFYPTSESRQFTREDASRAFNENLLPSDKRIPHPQLIDEIREQDLSEIEQRKLRQGRAKAEAEALAEEKRAEKERIEKETTLVEGERAVYRFRDTRADLTGPNGRDPRGLGNRYGVPSQARRKGVPKYPTKVDA